MSIQTLDREEPSQLLTDSEWKHRDHSRRLPVRHFEGEGISISSEPTMILFAEGSFVFAEPLTDWFGPILEQICKLGELRENWDSYGGRPVNPYCAEAAISLLLLVLERDTPAPAVVPTNRGGLQIEWHRGGMDVEVEIQSPSRFHLVVDDQRSGEQREEVITSNLKPLISVLEKLTATE